MTFATMNKEPDNIEIYDKEMTLEKLSSVVVDSKGINEIFNELLFDYVLRSSSFYNRIVINDEIQLINENGDIISLFFNDKKQVEKMVFSSYSNPVEISLQKDNDTDDVSILKTVKYYGGAEYITKSTFYKDDDSYIQRKLITKYIEKKDDLETSYESVLESKDDKVTLLESVKVKEDENLLSQTAFARTLEPSDYVKIDGIFRIIRPYKGSDDVLRVVSTSRKLFKEMIKNY